MICSSCGTECADNQDICSSCGASLKAEPAVDTAASVDPVQVNPEPETSGKPVSKKPVKLDIAAILGEAAGTDAAQRCEAEESDSEDTAPEDIKQEEQTDNGHLETQAAEAVPEERAADAEAHEEPEEPISAAEVLLLTLCILLGLGILAVIILIIWPNIIPTLFYHV